MWHRAVALALAALCAAAVLPPPDTEPARLHSAVGGYVVLECYLDFPFGHEIPYHLHWDKDGESVYSWYSGWGSESEAVVGAGWKGRVRRVGGNGGGGGAINVSAVREGDGGVYTCRVTFPNRTPPARNNGTRYRLEVAGGAPIAVPPVNVTVREGERAELECRPRDGAAAVEWRRADVSLAPELVAPNGSLVLERAASADLGEYTCLVRDPAGNTQAASAFLDVHYAAKVVHSPEERALPLGAPASLDCHFSANPPLTNLRWEKDGFLFDPYNVPGVFYSRNGSLLFNQVDESHEGQYSCTPYNALGTAGPGGRVRVRVVRPAALRTRPAPLYVARLGGAVTLPCAREDGAPAVWRRADGEPLSARHVAGAQGLTVSSVDERDGGVYVCAADEGADPAETELVVENAPPRAAHLLAAVPRARALHVSWRAPAPAPSELEYAVWYRVRGAGEWRTLRLLSRGATEATVGGLRPDTEYEVRVLAQDPLGDGLFSRPLFVRTLAEGEEQGEGITAVTAVTAESEPPTTETPWEAEAEQQAGEELPVSVRLVEGGALVMWERAEAEGARCTLRWYEGDRLVAVAHTHHDHYLVKEVSPGAQYSARVSCTGAGGWGAVTLHVPPWGRLRAAAVGCAVSALLLVALAGALYAARRHLRRSLRRPPPPPPKRR